MSPIDHAKKEVRLIQQVPISHPNRVLFPDTSITKGDLASFYAEMGEFILPAIKNRPISVVRCPSGLSKECFYQRSKGEGMPIHIKKINLTHEGKTHDYIYIEDIKGLLELVQMGVIEFHPWGSSKDAIESPDRIIFDLDPSPVVPFEAVKLAALDIKGRLNNMGLKSFAKLTGGKGIHITAPIKRKEKWDRVKAFARGLAEQMAKEAPEAYTATMSKSKRKGKIFIDFFRNDYAATAVGDYCVRSRPGAPVVTPIEWGELSEIPSAGYFHMEDVLFRKKKAKKIFKTSQTLSQSLPVPSFLKPQNKN